MTEPIRYRPSWRQLAVWPLLLPASQVMTMVFVDVPRSSRIATFVGWCLSGVLAWWLQRTMGVDLTDDALVMRRFRRRPVPWRSIEWIGEVPKSWGVRTVGVHYRGRLRRLPAPYHHRFAAPDPDFDAKLRKIYETWVRAIAPASPPASPPALPRGATSAGYAP